MQQNITIQGVEGRALPLVHVASSPMPATEAGKSYEVPRTAYYVRAWKRGDVASEQLDAEHGIKPKTVKTKTQAPEAGEK